MSGASGAENHLLELTGAISKYGWTCDVLIPSPQPDKLSDLIARFAQSCERVEVMPMRYDGSFRLLARLASLLGSGRYDVIHAHLVHAEWHLSAASLIARKVPLVSSKHNPDAFRTRAAFRLMERVAMRRYAAVIAISESLREFTEASTGVQAVTVPYGLAAPADPAPRKYDRRIATQILAVGRLEEQKGFDVAIQAMAMVRKVVPDVHLSIAGDGRQRQKLEDRIAALKIADVVSILGRRDDVLQLMSNADILVHPARWEGFGLVLLEAMRAGLPIVASRVAAVPEVVNDGLTGILVPPNDASALAAALVRLVQEPALRERLGAGGFHRLKEHFPPELMARRTASVYESVVRGGR